MAIEQIVASELPNVLKALLLIAPVVGCGYFTFGANYPVWAGMRVKAHDHPVDSIVPGEGEIITVVAGNPLITRETSGTKSEWVEEGERTPSGSIHVHTGTISRRDPYEISNLTSRV